MKRGAIFDATGCYRYWLWRTWDSEAAALTFIMLNPSTADDQVDDATIRRCIRFAQAWNYGSLSVVNLFALVATYPQQLRSAADPVGHDCDRYLLEAVDRAAQVIVAWGNWGRLHQRDQAVLSLLAAHQPLYCLGTCQNGQPRHPLYLPKSIEPTQYGSH
ncbi:MAG: DUF1643 domain-containing protein [Elainellaceae cyanobacterium]